MNQVTGIVVGAGSRGTTYASYALDHPDRFKIVGVADPRLVARERIKKWFNIEENNAVDDWKKLASRGKLADLVIIATPDRLHKETAVTFAKLGYHMLLEKPMSISREECEEIARVCQASGVFVAICHVLRYFPPVHTIKNAIIRGDIGDVVHIQHTERIGFWHFAHSFVRGNWKNSQESCFSLLSKCCHDVDLIRFWMGDKKCMKISSFGSLFHFKKENKPENASTHCLDCKYINTCPYSAKKIYLDLYDKTNSVKWPSSVVCDMENDQHYKQNLTKALLNGPYGRCVYECNNDVCDNQTVQFQFDDSSTATLTMIAFTEELCLRETKIYGTKGQLVWNGKTEGPIQLFDFQTQTTTNLKIESLNSSSSLTGHGGADFYLMDSFIKAVSCNDQCYILTGVEDSLQSHLLVFAAEESRIKGETIDYQKYCSNSS